jgi:hypothetical protein
VEQFNDSVGDWQERTGCIANFMWDYKNGRSIAIQTIDFPIYRKTADTSQLNMKDVLADAEKTS